MFYEESEARRLVIEAGHRLLENKLIARTWGNISARIGVDEFVITPSGRGYDDLEPADLVVVRVSDCSYDGDIKPSSEKGVHAAAYALRDNVNFIIHTHQYYASAVAAECKDVSFAPCAEYALPGTDKLRRNVEIKILENPDMDAFLMARHGALLIAEDMESAFAKAEELEGFSRRLVDKRVPSHDMFVQDRLDIEAVKCELFPCVTVARDQYLMECCQAGVKVGPYLDDFAQIVGPDMIVVDNDPKIIQRALLGYDSGLKRSQSKGSGSILETIGSALSDAASKGVGGIENLFGSGIGGAIGTGARGLGGLVRKPMTGALHQMGGMHPVLNSVIGRNAVLVRGVGAVCAAMTQDDADAAAMIASKNCAAACYVRTAKPLGPIDARTQRYVYLTKYSKLKNKK